MRGSVFRRLHPPGADLSDDILDLPIASLARQP